MVMLDRVRVLAAIAALTACGEICTGANAAAQNLQAVSVIAFPGTGNWPIRIAQDKGYFVQAGIEVTLTPTPNSVFQMTNLIEGKFDIAMTAVDNVIAYEEGQGEAAVSTAPDLFVFMGGSPSGRGRPCGRVHRRSIAGRHVCATGRARAIRMGL
jgi:ABC-type nitrate/sulfonate/bicarbonate transport system substrate-binding protein